jgi:hypothetical protein
MARGNSFEDRRWAAESLSRHAFWPTNLAKASRDENELDYLLTTLIRNRRISPTLHL